MNLKLYFCNKEQDYERSVQVNKKKQTEICTYSQLKFFFFFSFEFCKYVGDNDLCEGVMWDVVFNEAVQTNLTSLTPSGITDCPEVQWD